MTIQNKNIIKISDESTCIDNPPPKKTKDVKSSKSSRCKDTTDWVELEYGDEYKKQRNPHRVGSKVYPQLS